MSTPRRFDFGPLDAVFEERARAVAACKRRIDTLGMTRPERAPAEREFLAQRASSGPFVEAGPASRRVGRVGRRGNLTP